MIALVHLVTLGWISSSIIGAFYIVGPLALRLPLPAGRADRLAFVSYVLGVSGMVSHFWIGEYTGMAWSAGLVIVAVVYVAVRAWRGLTGSPAPWPVKLHVAFAFTNIIGAGLFGIVVGLNRLTGWFAWSPLSAAFAHAHLAAVGWAVMMVVGLSYRLISMARSAILLQAGVIVLVIAVLRNAAWTALSAVLILAALASFVSHVRSIVRTRRPPPAALPRPDWATWQTHVAFAWLLISAVAGTVLTLPIPSAWTISLGWLYGVAGLVGFLSQVVVGIQGRLLPLHGWYRLFAAAGMKPPERSAHTLASHRLSKWILVAWTVGVPLLAGGLASSVPALVAGGSAFLLAGAMLNGVQAFLISTAAREPR
jgi:hypothetical protein